MDGEFQWGLWGLRCPFLFDPLLCHSPREQVDEGEADLKEAVPLWPVSGGGSVQMRLSQGIGLPAVLYAHGRAGVGGGLD